MAIRHQISVTNNLQFIPKLKHPPRNFFLYPYPTSSSSNNKNFNIKLSLNTNGVYTSNSDHYEYEKGLTGSSQQYPRPEEVPWKKELCNSVQLIGTVGTPVEFKELNSGKVLASCRLAVRKSATDTTWINLTFWDELAHVASQHVEKGQQIYVAGRLVSDTVDSDDGKQQTYYKVVVQQLKFVERSAPSAPSYNGDFNYSNNSSSNLSSIATGKKQKNFAANGTGAGSVEKLWQEFFVNPVDWWDNRKNKRSPNYPDFKHKDTGEALWVEGRMNPSWVKAELSKLDSRMESFHDQHANMRSDSFGDHLTPY
ncbi:protein OSB1, mitochondrial-like [Bidens hawaiensis]|uniref:protein OSB1, mitochondrial-like n=1 Tax=Bidens hawaiensis TaxID=980011 RepID=UPI0040498872